MAFVLVELFLFCCCYIYLFSLFCLPIPMVECVDAVAANISPER